MSKELLRTRIGNTVTVVLPVLTRGDAVSLVGRDITIMLVDPNDVKTPVSFTVGGVDNNIATFVVEGTSQSATGTYRAEVYENYRGTAMAVYDCDIFVLVARTEYENDGNDGVSSETTTLDPINIAWVGRDGYTPYIQDGYWYINGTSTNVKAAGENGDTPYIENGYWYIGGVSTGIKVDYTNEETQRAASEQVRVVAEAARVQAEAARTLAENSRLTEESGRSAAEGVRILAERDRQAAETTRQTQEEIRHDNEEARVEAELGRAASEASRAQVEATRVTNETARTTAEATRAANEQTRVSEETDRAAAETARIAAETARETAEGGRTSAEATRVSNEQTRVSNETTRQSNESARQAAETARQAAYVAAEDARDAAFAAKEATRDAANEAALNCAETLAALGPKIEQIYPDVIQMREAFSGQTPLDSVELMARMAVNTSKVEPSNNTYTSAYEVKAGRKYHINASIIWTNATIGAIGFVAGELPTAAKSCTVLNAFEVKTYSEDYVPSEDGYILITHQINSNVYLTSGEVLGTAYFDYSARINNLATKVSTVVDKDYEYSVAIPSAEAKNTISAGQRCDIDDVAPGESITINITRGGGMANKNLRIWFCVEPNSQSSSNYAQLEVSASTNSVTWENTKSVAIKSVAVYVYADETRVTDGTLSLDIILAGRTSKALAAANNAMTMVNGLSTEVTELDGKVESVQAMTTGIEYEYSADIPAVNAKNTNSAGQRLDISEVKTGRKLNISISRSGGMVGKVVRIWYCSEPNAQSTSTYNYVDYAGNVNEVEYTNNQSYSIKSIAIYVYQDDSRTANGNVTLEINTQGVIENHEERITALEGASEAKVTLTDVLYHWMNGEKFPIGFHGDSTTDGVATTGWSVSNSHPAQDEAEGGTGARGVVDYICQLAYPYILEKMLQSELGNNNLRVYNIGYYGASLNNNYSQLSAIYGGVYADVKMVGLTLSINDRGLYSSDAEYYAGLVTKLGQFVDFYLDKGIIPFMVTQQVVTQNGNDPNLAQYGVMYQNHVQEISNLAKRYVAKKYDLEVIDMNEFGRLLMKASSYSYTDLTEDLHFKDLGHRLEAGFLFSELVPWVNKSGDAKTIYFGFNCANNKTGFRCGNVDAVTNDKFKSQINYTRSGDTSNVLIFDAYMFVDSKDGAYNVKYLTPRASGYIVLDGDTSNPITIDSTEMTLQPWDIGLHHVQVYTGASEYVAFKGFLLEQ